MVWYFNLNEPNRLSIDDLEEWGYGAGGTPSEITDFEGAPTGEYSDSSLTLPNTFSNWSDSTVSWVDGDTSSWGWDEEVVPAHTQGASGRVMFALNSDAVASIVSASGSGAASVDPTQALAQGIGAPFSTTFNITDLDQGYTASVEISGQLQPWTSNVANAAPGEFDAFSRSTVRGSQTNTTAERNTRTIGISVIALYPLGTAICNGYNGISVRGDGWSDSSYCARVVGGIGAADLAPGGQQAFPPAQTDHELGSFLESSAALAELNAPVAVYAMFGGKGAGLTGIDWNGDRGCHVQSGIASGQWVVGMDGWPDVLCN